MQIKFLTAYYISNEDGLILAQEDLLSQWQQSIELSNLKYISRANVEFIDYAILDYPDQEKLKKKFDDSLFKKYNTFTRKYYWYALGNRYEDFDVFYKDIAATHRVMELTITPEDY